MRIALASILFLTSIGLVILGARWRSNSERPVWNQAVISYRVPNVPAEFDREIAYSSKRSDVEVETDDGPTEYLRHHQLAWDDCIYYFYRDWSYGESSAWSAGETTDGWGPWVIGAPDHINDARRDGWYDASAQLGERLKSTTESDLRAKLPHRRPVMKIPLAFGAAACFIAGALVLWLQASKYDANR